MPPEMVRLLKLENVWRGEKLSVNLEKLKTWSEQFSSKKEFGAFYHSENTDQNTLLYVLTWFYDELEKTEVDKMIDFLLNECEADPDAGVARKNLLTNEVLNTTPFLLAKNNATLKHLLERFEKAQARVAAEKERIPFITLYKKWKNKETNAQAVIGYFTQSGKARAEIDACMLDDGSSVRDDLELMGSDDAKKILAYAGPYQKDVDNGLKNLVVGCVEYGLPKDLVSTLHYQARERGINLTCDIDTIKLDATRTIGLYLHEKLMQKDTHAKALYESLGAPGAYFNQHRSGLPADISRMEADWLWPNRATAEQVCQLLLHCAMHPARMEELKRFLHMKNDIISLETMSYQGETFSAYYSKLDDALYPHKKVVLTLLEQHTLGVLMNSAIADPSSFDAFKKFFDAHPWDIDTIKFSTSSLGDRLTIKKNDVTSYVQPYRSNPWEAQELRRYVNRLISGTDLSAKATGYKALRILSQKKH